MGTMTDSNWGTDHEMWRTIPLPYVPSDEDVALLRQLCPPELLGDSAAPRILVLGVTPPLIGAGWPAASEVHAVDFDHGAIDTLWQPGERRRVHCARWQEIPFPDAHFDLVIGDCSFNALPGIEQYDEVIAEVDRVRKPSAPLITRFFMQSEPRLTLDYLMREASGLFAGYRPYALLMLVPIAASEANGVLHATDTAGRIVEQCGDVEAFLSALGLDEEGKWRARRTFEFDQFLNFPISSSSTLNIWTASICV